MDFLIGEERGKIMPKREGFFLDRNGRIVGDADNRDMYQQRDGSFGPKPINAKQRNATERLNSIHKSRNVNKGK